MPEKEHFGTFKISKLFPENQLQIRANPKCAQGNRNGSKNEVSLVKKIIGITGTDNIGQTNHTTYTAYQLRV
jgi:hypothetical protein